MLNKSCIIFQIYKMVTTDHRNCISESFGISQFYQYFRVCASHVIKSEWHISWQLQVIGLTKTTLVKLNNIICMILIFVWLLYSTDLCFFHKRSHKFCIRVRFKFICFNTICANVLRFMFLFYKASLLHGVCCRIKHKIIFEI